MKKIIAILILISVVVLVIGCTAPEDINTPAGDDNFTVNTAAEANNAVGDIGTDLSGISDSLDDIDDTLTES